MGVSGRMQISTLYFGDYEPIDKGVKEGPRGTLATQVLGRVVQFKGLCDPSIRLQCVTSTPQFDTLQLLGC